MLERSNINRILVDFKSLYINVISTIIDIVCTKFFVVCTRKIYLFRTFCDKIILRIFGIKIPNYPNLS